jgi:hypothetical protein
MPGGPALFDRERIAWIRGDRASRYRQRAEHLEQIADAEPRARQRERLLEFATQYQQLGG